MQSNLPKRAVIISELRFAHEEMARLNDMIPILQASHLLDEPRLSELLFERSAAYKRAIRLHVQLRKLDGTGVAQVA